METISTIFESKRSKQVVCEYHRKGKETTCKADNAFELVGMGFKASIANVSSGDVQPPAMAGHLHCGCPASEVALEFFLWKTSRGFSSNPMNSANVYRMSDLHMLKPSTRAFWNQSLRDYTGLLNEDFFGLDYGEYSYASRIALKQLHTQIERLRMLGAPVNINLEFTDRISIDPADDVVAYGLEADSLVMASGLEEIWKEMRKKQVVPLPMLSIDYN